MYLHEKLEMEHILLPQIVGLTASPGAGKRANTEDMALEHLLELCAHLDAEHFVTVKTHAESLIRFVTPPSDGKSLKLFKFILQYADFTQILRFQKILLQKDRLYIA